MNNIKIAFFDIDGTILKSNKEITTNTINTLNKLHNKGIKIVLCSGRPNTFIYELSNKIGCVKYGISSNGSLIYDYVNNQDIYSNKIDNNTIEAIWNYSLKNKHSLILNSYNIRYKNIYIKMNKNDLYLINNIKEIKSNIFQFIINFDNESELNNLKKILNIYNLKVINCSMDYFNKNVYGYHWVDIVNNNVSKGNAIKYLLKKLNIDKKDAICFGDSINDIEMFNECGIKVAMGNALNDLKVIADYITDSNENDGITKFFDKHFNT